MVAAVCPAPEQLKSYLLGCISEDQAGLLEQHLAGCPDCLAALQRLQVDDPFITVLRAMRSSPPVKNPVIEQLRLRICQLQPAPDQATIHTPHSASHAATPPPEASSAATPQPESYPFLEPPQQAEEIGRLGGYRVLRRLGAGGMGIVFEAEETLLRRAVALKVMQPSLAADTQARQRFLREAQAIAALLHDHIVPIYQVSVEAGVPYLAMPLLQGQTLEARQRREGPLPLAEVLRIGREVALGLAAAHERNIIHRDVKPNNLWLEAPTGRVKILDFGLARMERPQGEQTSAGAILGTPGYMAPEQFDGNVDARADLFSLGCVLYQMTTGQLPFPGETPLQRMRSVLLDTPVPPQQLNPALPLPVAQFIQRLLAKKREERPVSAAVVARVLETLGAQLPQAAAAPVVLPTSTPPQPEPNPEPRPEPARTTRPHRRWQRWALVGAAATLLLGLGWLAWRPLPEPEIRPSDAAQRGIPHRSGRTRKRMFPSPRGRMAKHSAAMLW